MKVPSQNSKSSNNLSAKPIIGVTRHRFRIVLRSFLLAALATLLVHLSAPGFFLPTAGGPLDQWLYAPSPESFEYISRYFSETYYFRRWTLQLPFLWISGLLTDAVALYWLVATFKFFIVCFLSCVLVQTLPSPPGMEVLAVILLVSEPFFFNQISSTYSQGTVLAFLLLSMILVSKWSESLIHKIVMGMISGLAYGVAFISYQAVIMMAPLLVAYTAAKHGFWVRQKPVSSLKSLLPSMGGQVAGFWLAVTAIDRLVMAILKPGIPPLLSQTVSITNTNHASRAFGTSLPEFVDWALTMPGSATFWLVLPLLAYLLLHIALKRRQSTLILLSVGWIMSWSLFLARTWLGAHPFSADYIRICLTFFGILLVFHFAIGLAPKKTRIPIMWTMVGAYVIPNLAGMSFGSQTGWHSALLVSLGLASMLILNTNLDKMSKPRRWRFLDFGGAVLIGIGISMFFANSPYLTGKLSADELRSVRAEVDVIARTGLEANAKVWIWDQRYDFSPTISSLYGNYSALTNYAKPEEISCGQIEWIKSYEQNLILIIQKGGTDSSPVDQLLQLETNCSGGQRPILSASLEKTIAIDGQTIAVLRPLLWG